MLGCLQAVTCDYPYTSPFHVAPLVFGFSDIVFHLDPVSLFDLVRLEVAHDMYVTVSHPVRPLLTHPLALDVQLTYVKLLQLRGVVII